jgi:hypothetical protein
MVRIPTLVEVDAAPSSEKELTPSPCTASAAWAMWMTEREDRQRNDKRLGFLGISIHLRGIERLECRKGNRKRHYLIVLVLICGSRSHHRSRIFHHRPILACDWSPNASVYLRKSTTTKLRDLHFQEHFTTDARLLLAQSCDAQKLAWGSNSGYKVYQAYDCLCSLVNPVMGGRW